MRSGEGGVYPLYSWHLKSTTFIAHINFDIHIIFFYKLTVSKGIGRKFKANIHLLAFVMTLRQNHLFRLLKHS